MPQNNRDVIQAIIDWLATNAPLLYTFGLTVIIAFFRLLYDHTDQRKRVIESLLCGFIALAVSASLEHFGFPESLSPFVGGVIGFLGIDKIREVGDAVLNKKINTREKKEDDE